MWKASNCKRSPKKRWIPHMKNAIVTRIMSEVWVKTKCCTNSKYSKLFCTVSKLSKTIIQQKSLSNKKTAPKSPNKYKITRFIDVLISITSNKEIFERYAKVIAIWTYNCPSQCDAWLTVHVDNCPNINIHCAKISLLSENDFLL